MRVKRFRFLTLLGFLGLLTAGCHQHTAVEAGPQNVEFASFYAEMAGDFADPIDSDAPVHY